MCTSINYNLFILNFVNFYKMKETSKERKDYNFMEINQCALFNYGDITTRTTCAAAQRGFIPNPPSK